jgi:cysteine desulfuration protein SufE
MRRDRRVLVQTAPGRAAPKPRARLTTVPAPRKAAAMTIATFDAVEAEFDALDDWDDRYRLLIDLGRALPPMPAALKTEATRVRGCASQVWLHPRLDAGRLHFAADSDAAIVKGLIALVLMLANDRRPADIDTAAIRQRLDGLGLSRHLSSNRTQGLASMVARIDALAREAA